MADDSADLVIDGNSRRVAMDLTTILPQSGAGTPKEPGQVTHIEGEVHDQEDLSGTDAILKIDGVGDFHVTFFTPTRFRGALSNNRDQHD